MNRFFEEFGTKALFGFVVFFALAMSFAFLFLIYTAMGNYFFLFLLGLIVFYTIGHFVYEAVENK